MTKTQKTKKGFAVLYAVLVSSAVLVIGAAVADRVIKESRLSSSIRDSQVAFAAADAALECALFWDQQHPGYADSVFGDFENPISGDVIDGRVGHWRFNDGAGFSAADSSGSGNVGALANMETPTDWIAGKTGYAVDLDGSNEYVSIGDVLDIGSSNLFSLSLWVRLDSTVRQSLISKGVHTGTGVGWQLQYRESPNNEVWFSIHQNGTYTTYRASTDIADGNWHHIVFVYESRPAVATIGDIAVYVDGNPDTISIQAANVPPNTNFDNATNLTFGTRTDGAGGLAQFVNGALDDVRFYNRALTEGEAENIYKAGNLIGFWALNENEGTVANDSSLSDSDGLLTNFSGTSWTPNGQVGYALQFDGSNDYVDIENDKSGFNFTSPALTVAAWVYFDTDQTGERAVVRKDAQWQLGVFPSGNLVRNLVYTNGTNGWVQTNDEAVTINPNTWYHLAFTYNGSVLKHYVNGNQIGPDKIVTGNIVANTNDVAIGGNTDDGAPDVSVDGRVDDVRVYSRVLTPDEIEALADNEGSIFIPPLDQHEGVVTCNGADINDPGTGWDPVNGWDVTTLSEGSEIVFDINLSNGTCAEVTVTKDNGATTIDSRGYNTCDETGFRRIERGLRATY